MAEHVGHLRAAALLGVGAAFDFLSGEVRQAPRWIQRSGFEWAFRAATEPRRLARRYLRNVPSFMCAIVCSPPRIWDETQGGYLDTHKDPDPRASSDERSVPQSCSVNSRKADSREEGPANG
jgi:hypothetical protein